MLKRKINLENIICDIDFNDELLFDVTHNGYGKTMYTKIAMKKAMLEFGKQLLELAAENAKVESVFDDNGEINEISESIYKPHPYDKRQDENVHVNKQSILDTINQIK